MPRRIASDDDDEMEEEQGQPIGDYDDDDDDEEEGQDEYEKDDFIVDDVEEEPEEEPESDDEKSKKKKRKKRETYVLDEDDYALLEDNNITGFQRPKAGNKKFKRLKKARGDGGEEQSGYSDEEEFGTSGKEGPTAEEKLKRTLFGDDEAGPLEDIAEEEVQSEEEQEEIGEEDEMADFIVDEEDIDEHGLPVRRRKPSKKKARPTSGVSSSALKEAQDIFGDVDEYLSLRKNDMDTGEGNEKKLQDEFEPTILLEKYMTEKDDDIRRRDVPERLQIIEEITGPPPVDDPAEAPWVFKQFKINHEELFWELVMEVQHEDKESVMKRHIMNFLEMMHKQKLDLPFVAMYRKEDVKSLLAGSGQPTDEANKDNDDTRKLKSHKALWAVLELDKKWLLLQKRKSALEHYYHRRFEEESRRIYELPRLSLNQQLYDSITEALKTAESERDVDDVDLKFNLHFPPGDVVLDESQYKRPRRKSQYSICNKAGLWEVAHRFGYSSEQLGSRLTDLDERRKDELVHANETPEDVASNFTCAMFETPVAVLKGARHMAAVEISCEPRVRKYMRETFTAHALVSTKPTAHGTALIDPFHQFAGVKWLKNKPLKEFKDAQWLLIQKAEEEKLLHVTVKLSDDRHADLLNDFSVSYLSDDVSKSAQPWNDQRKQITEDALFNLLIPSMEKETRSLLSVRSKNWLMTEYRKTLWEKACVAPYTRKENGNDDTAAAPRVMACCWGPGKPATTFVMLDSSGEVLDVLYSPSLMLRSQNVTDQQRKKNDQERLLKFMTDHQPHVVVLGAANLYCPKLKDDVYEVIFKMIEENPRDVGNEMDGLSIVFGDESLPRLYENSRASSEELPSQPGLVRRAVALGRYLQNPLAMVSVLCGPGREVLSWKLHPMEEYISCDERYAVIEEVMVDISNQVSMDINLASSHEWLAAPLQFVSGLGPRMAASLQRNLSRTGAIFTRKDFVTVHGLGKKVFLNCVGFLRVRRSGLAASSSQYIDLLDDTRIHPESYSLAQKMAKDIFKAHTGQHNDDDDDDTLEMAIEHVRDKPDCVKYFDLNEYMKNADERVRNKWDTVHGVLMELGHAFRDLRKPYEAPTPDEEFYMLSGETERTLAEGKVVQVTVRRVQSNRAFCALESGITGIITKEDFVDDARDVVDMADRLNDGDILSCKIKAMEKNRHLVHLVCKESVMAAEQLTAADTVSADPYYDASASSHDAGKPPLPSPPAAAAKKHFKPRMIVHPRFQNVAADAAEEFLCGKEIGESVFRPSPRGPMCLTLTLKVCDGVYAHKDIAEGGKERGEITSLLRIGRTLRIGDDTFEDLDEVVDRYVDPLVTHLKAMLGYRKFRSGTKAEIDDVLRAEKAENPMRIVYAFGVCHEHPGTFILTYVRSSNPHHEYVGLYPKGFKFKRRMFDVIDRLVAYFQRHINDPSTEAAPASLSVRSVAAMVPMRSPSTGGASVGSAWGNSGASSGSWRSSSATPEHCGSQVSGGWPAGGGRKKQW